MKTELTLPIELCKLDLKEIGAIFVLLSIPNMEQSFIDYWKTNTDFLKEINQLMEEEIIIQMDDETIEIDLTWV
jgi:hypothetical protein